MTTPTIEELCEDGLDPNECIKKNTLINIIKLLACKIVELIESFGTKDETKTVANNHPLIWGLSAGQVNKPNGMAQDVNDILNADINLEVSYRSMTQLFSNRAAQSDGKNSLQQRAGMMNHDGSLGFFKNWDLYGLTSMSPLTDTRLSQRNGGLYQTIDPNEGAVITVDEGKYYGQVVEIRNSAGAFLGFEGSYTLDFSGGAQLPPSGTFRAEPYGPIGKGVNMVGSPRKVDSRFGEYIRMVWMGLMWEVQQDYRLLRGINYQETEGGDYEIEGTLPYNPAAYPAWTVPPVIVDGATSGNYIGRGARR